MQFAYSMLDLGWELAPCGKSARMAHLIASLGLYLTGLY